MAIHLESSDLVNTQQLEVAVNGPDGATHLILCTGIAKLSPCSSETFTFFVGPEISWRQFVGAIAAGALSTIQHYGMNGSVDNATMKLEANIVSMKANYDDESKQVKVSATVSSSSSMTKLAISYNVSILAELSTL